VEDDAAAADDAPTTAEAPALFVEAGAGTATFPPSSRLREAAATDEDVDPAPLAPAAIAVAATATGGLPDAEGAAAGAAGVRGPTPVLIDTRPVVLLPPTLGRDDPAMPAVRDARRVTGAAAGVALPTEELSSKFEDPASALGGAAVDFAGPAARRAMAAAWPDAVRGLEGPAGARARLVAESASPPIEEQPEATLLASSSSSSPSAAAAASVLLAVAGVPVGELAADWSRACSRVLAAARRCRSESSRDCDAASDIPSQRSTQFAIGRS